MRLEILRRKEYIKAIVDIHMETFPNFFLTFLGRGFLKHLYCGFMEHEQSDLIVCLDELGEVLGFCAYSEDLSGFYKYLIKKRLIPFAWYAAGGFIRKPKIFFRLLRAFTYSDNSVKEEKYVELSSIGVAPAAKKRGVGSAMIQFLIQQIDREIFEYIKLETDRENNEGANSFYRRNGFVLYDTYETREGRKMNEYRFRLQGEAE